MGAGVFSTFAFFMSFKSFFQVFGGAGVETVVFAEEDVDEPH